MENYIEVSDWDDKFEVIDVGNLQEFLSEDEINHFDMTSLGTLMLLEHSTTRTSEESNGQQDDNELDRLSLAYERLHTIPKILIEELAPRVRILDISHNEFDYLDFLSEFCELTHLICDRNNITSKTTIPFMPKLELLWLNHCKISELYPWARKLLRSCPNLKFLSLMGNPVAPSVYNGITFFEYVQYRSYLISLFPYLVHLDDKMVTPMERKESQELYHRPLMGRIVLRTYRNLPPCLRDMSERVSEMLESTPSFAAPEKNFIV